MAGSSPGSIAQKRELRGLGRRAVRDGSSPRSGGGGKRRAARLPGAVGAQVQAPCDDAGVGAAGTLV